jgi:hypothetical protein
MRFCLLVAIVLVIAPTIAAADLSDGAIPGERLAALIPAKAGGIGLYQPFDQAFAAGGAYLVGPDQYANLDIQNTFHRGGQSTSRVDFNLTNKELCPKRQKIAGFMACLRVKGDRTTLFWYLPDRLTVTLSAPSEKLARAMAADLKLAAIAKLSAAR